MVPSSPEEAAVAFIRLHHHPVRRAEAGVGAVIVDDAAVDDGRVDAARVEQRGDEAGGGGLAMGAGDGDRRFQPHQFGEHLGAADDGDAVGERGLDLWIAAFDGGRGDDDRRALHIGGVMTDVHGDAAFAQALDDIAIGDVTALHPIAEIVHDFGDAGHADAADADEWMVPMSVPTPLMWRGHLPGALAGGVGGAADRDDVHQARAAGLFDEVGEIAGGIGAADAKRAGGGIFERAGFECELLHLLGEFYDGKIGLGNRPRAADADHFADIMGLVIVGRRGQRDEDGGTTGSGKFSDGRGPGAATTRCAQFSFSAISSI